MRAVRSIAPPRSEGAEVVAAAGLALAADPTCAHARALRGFVRATIDGDPMGGLAELDASIAIDAGLWVVRGLRAWTLLAAGRPQDAVAEARVAVDLNPWASWFCSLHAQYLLFVGNPQLALDAARSAVTRFPEVDVSRFVASQVASACGLHDEAIAEGRKAAGLAPDAPLFHTSLASALARAGRHREARALIAAIERADTPLPAAWLAPAWRALGERERAVDMILLSRDQGAPQYVYTFYDPRLAALRSHPRLPVPPWRG